MKMFLITDDSDTKIGLRFAGVDGVVVKDESRASEAIDKALADTEVCVLLVTEGIRRMCPDKVMRINALAKPVLCEIPDSKNPDSMGSSLEEYIKNAVGISL